MSDERATPRVVHDLRPLLADDTTVPPGVVWRLAEPGRQLDANVLRLGPDQVVETHTESDLDVLLVVVSGTGTLEGADGPIALAAGTTLWLPRGSTRRLSAGAQGLGYLTVHRRRPGMQITPGPPA
ncbi:cupin domain-containing protein [Pseudonocardia sp. RS11V-5]|uniref:cupin domain-containing protein n=1 Tax=Pseudonocardia terrae TaxID=2905831 RepID=UPI001E3622F9|nr:cupin domain-containing protein [Pseudonocardia terrae]MCE3551491.1 cupin domain-containing protein [Pseudonocardia terrae]